MLNSVRNQLSGAIISAPRVGFELLKALFNRRWWWATLAVLLGMAVLARLGVWQLDRLEQRRARNAQIIQQSQLAPLSLKDITSLPDDLTELKYRQGIAAGQFDFTRQILLMHQNRMNMPGSHLITPLVLEGSNQAILVDRGWIPADQSAPENWPQFDEADQATVTGFIQLSQTLPNRGGDVVEVSPSKPRLEWYRVDIEAVQAQMPYPLLPVYLLQSPGENNTTPPYRIEQEFDLSDGPHLGYAIQWFIFSAILGVMYVRYVTKKEAQDERSEEAE
jgi:surfeit locus 1 family protein